MSDDQYVEDNIVHGMRWDGFSGFDLTHCVCVCVCVVIGIAGLGTGLGLGVAATGTTVKFEVSS